MGRKRRCPSELYCSEGSKVTPTEARGTRPVRKKDPTPLSLRVGQGWTVKVGLTPCLLTSASRLLPIWKPLKWMQKATEPEALAPLPILQRSAQSYLEHSWGGNFLEYPGLGDTFSLFPLLCFSCISTRLQDPVLVKSLKKEGDTAWGNQQGKRAGGGRAMSGLVWSGLVSLSTPTSHAFTWKLPNLKYKWDPLGSQNSSPHSCTASIYSCASLQPQAASETHFWGQRLWTPGSMSLENRIAHKEPIMVLWLFFRARPNPQRL